MPDQETRRWRQAVARVPALDKALRRVRRTDAIMALQAELAEAQSQEQRAAPAEPTPALTVEEGTLPFLTWRPPGHYYSPVPNMKDIERDAARIFTRPEHLEGLDVREEAQLALLTTLGPLARDVAFAKDPAPDQRYFTDNPSYGPADAAITQAFLRHLQPARYLEVGSGWTTALALDTNEKWLDGRMRMTCIEPYPVDLRRLVRPGDAVEIIERPVQDVPLERFAALDAGDVLFIDCSHVVRTGSDAQHLITRVLPIVPRGVYIHMHDIFWAFEYPQAWVEEGRAWSEAYLLHAFLLFNPAFEIVFFNDFMAARHQELLTREIPATWDGAGGAIWLRRVA